METKKFKIIMGVEIHTQLNTNYKLFSYTLINTKLKENKNSNEIDKGIPGTLPILNIKVIELAIFFGKLIKGTIENYIKFDRKHYFYPDLPKGYQITQKNFPIIKNGFITLSSKKKIIIQQVHIEEDTGKLNHKIDQNYSYIDYNRSGIALLEIVTKPILTSRDEVIEYIKKIHKLLKRNNISKCRLEKGEFRCDINISLKKKNIKNYKIEIKNLNSFKSIKESIDYEIKRQKKILTLKKNLTNETRYYNKLKKITYKLRKKEILHEYAYCYEPNIPIIKITKKDINTIYKKMLNLKKKCYFNNENIIKYLKKKKLLTLYKYLIPKFILKNTDDKSNKFFQFFLNIIYPIIIKKKEKLTLIKYNKKLIHNLIQKHYQENLIPLNIFKIELKKIFTKTSIKQNTNIVKEKNLIINEINKILSEENLLFKKKTPNTTKFINFIIAKYIKKTNNYNNLSFIRTYLQQCLNN